MNDQTIEFDLDALVSRLKQAAMSSSPTTQFRSILRDAVRNPDRVRDGMPLYEEDEVILFEDDSVSIWHCRFKPGVSVPPHDHQMYATIGVYAGAERNEFFVKDSDGAIQSDTSVTLTAGAVLQIAPEDIHSVSCVSEDPCCGIHVYLGRLSTVERSLFDRHNGSAIPFTDDNYHRLVSKV